MIPSIGAILMGASRNVAKQNERLSPVELIERLNRVTTALIAAVEKNGGIVHQYVGGSLVAYWPPEKMPAGASDAIVAASEVIAACGDFVAVSVAIADLAVAEVGTGGGRRSMLVGAACQRAEATIRATAAGRAAVDSETLRSLPADIRGRFIAKDGYAELQFGDSAP